MLSMFDFFLLLYFCLYILSGEIILQMIFGYISNYSVESNRPPVVKLLDTNYRCWKMKEFRKPFTKLFKNIWIDFSMGIHRIGYNWCSNIYENWVNNPYTCLILIIEWSHGTNSNSSGAMQTFRNWSNNKL